MCRWLGEVGRHKKALLRRGPRVHCSGCRGSVLGHLVLNYLPGHRSSSFAQHYRRRRVCKWWANGWVVRPQRQRATPSATSKLTCTLHVGGGSPLPHGLHRRTAGCKCRNALVTTKDLWMDATLQQAQSYTHQSHDSGGTFGGHFAARLSCSGIMGPPFWPICARLRSHFVPLLSLYHAPRLSEAAISE